MKKKKYAGIVAIICILVAVVMIFALTSMQSGEPDFSTTSSSSVSAIYVDGGAIPLR